MNKKVKNILILVLIIIIAGLGYIFYPQKVDNEQQSNPNPVGNKDEEFDIKISDQEPEVITSDTDTSDWKTYRNEELGFEVKYPSDWEYRSWENEKNNDKNYQFSPAPVNAPSNDFGIYIYKKNMDIKDENVSDISVINKYVQASKIKNKSKLLNKIILNEILMFGEWQKNYSMGQRVYFVDNQKDLFIINFIPAGEIPLDIYNAILLSFKTIEK